MFFVFEMEKLITNFLVYFMFFTSTTAVFLMTKSKLNENIKLLVCKYLNSIEILTHI